MSATTQLCFNFFSTILEETTNVIFVKDEQSIIVYANQAFLNIYAPEKRDGLIGSTAYGDFDPAHVQIFLEEDRRAFAQGKTEITEEFVDWKGDLHVMLTKKICFTSVEGQRLMMGVGTNITELALRERALAQTNQQLASYAAVAAHDLRAPLATYVNLLDIVRYDEETTLSEESAGYLEMMRQSAKQLSTNISGLLSAYKADHGDTLARRSTDLNILFEEVRFNLTDAIGAVQARVLSNRLPMLDVDANLFRHLIHNLVENSIKYRKAEQVPIIVLKHERVGDTDTFMLEDNGRGISPAEEVRVFNLYDQGEKNAGASAGGIGLGLSLCKKVVEMHRGRIWIDHGYNSGCRICFSIPHAA